MGKILDTEHLFMVVADMLGNGVSTSPSNAPDEAAGPHLLLVTVRDQVWAQRRLLGHLGFGRLRLVMGWSMGAMQAYEWAVTHSDDVDAAADLRRSPLVRAQLRLSSRGAGGADGRPRLRRGLYTEPPVAGPEAFGRVYAGWACSRDLFHRGTYRELGHPSVQTVLDGWAADHAATDANDLLAMIDTWQSGDVGRDRPGGYEGALRSIRARTIVMPSTADAHFTIADSEIEALLVPGTQLLPLRSELGHIAGRPGIRAAVIGGAVSDLLAGWRHPGALLSWHAARAIAVRSRRSGGRRRWRRVMEPSRIVGPPLPTWWRGAPRQR